MIRILDRHIADKIAAGEVIERPLSIVKELVENSIDAGANNITVEIRNGGKSYIRITDNGCGIDESDVEIAFERHATGKISKLEDLDRIMTLGFRGEALASIAAISRVTLFTKTEHSVTGTKLELHAGRVVSKEKAGINKGTTIVVEDVFYNTPARRKFMKSDAKEATVIIELIQHLAIYYANISFRLINNGKTILNTLGNGNYRNTIMSIYPGKEFRNLIEIKGHNVHGFISDPGTTKNNRSGQLFFLNGRIIKSDIIEKGISEGYGDRIFSGYPIAILFITAEPDTVDVNVHPSKREVKFLDSAVIIDSIASAIRKVIKTEEAIPQAVAKEIKPEAPKQQTTQLGIKDYLSEKNRPELMKKLEPAVKEAAKAQDSLKSMLAREVHDVSASYKSSKDTKPKEAPSKPAFPAEPKREVTETPVYREPSEPKKPLQDVPRIPETKPETTQPVDDSIKLKASAVRPFNFDDLVVAGYVFNAYIITQIGETLFILDQHAAHERILYEQLITRYNNKANHVQPILTPLTIDTSSDIYNSEREFLSVLERLGFDIEDFGNNTFIIKGIPEYMGLNEAFVLATNIIESKELSSTSNQIVIDKIIMNSCKSAVKANDKLSDKEIQDLLDSLSKCVNPFSCPHGRPTFIKLTKYDLERGFRRR